MTDVRFRRTVVVLLSVVAICQLYSTIVGTFMRPTEGNIRASSGWFKQAVVKNVPLVSVYGSVDVDVSNTVDVQIENEPIQVSVQR